MNPLTRKNLVNRLALLTVRGDVIAGRGEIVGGAKWSPSESADTFPPQVCLYTRNVSVVLNGSWVTWRWVLPLILFHFLFERNCLAWVTVLVEFLCCRNMLWARSDVEISTSTSRAIFRSRINGPCSWLFTIWDAIVSYSGCWGEASHPGFPHVQVQRTQPPVSINCVFFRSIILRVCEPSVYGWYPRSVDFHLCRCSWTRG